MKWCFIHAKSACQVQQRSRMLKTCDRVSSHEHHMEHLTPGLNPPPTLSLQNGAAQFSDALPQFSLEFLYVLFCFFFPKGSQAILVVSTCITLQP